MLGTVQLGLPYGINNTTGKPTQNESERILDLASASGISILDSADAYGDSLRVIGQYLKDHPAVRFDIISKFIEDDQPVIEKFQATVGILSRQDLYAYMYHRFGDYRNGRSMDTLLRLREEKAIRKIGVSVYGIDELTVVAADPRIDLIQVPFNPFDASQEKNRLLTEAKSNGKEIHVRSIFLQGLFFKKPGELTGNLKGLAMPLTAFHEFIQSHNLTVTQACLNYALHNPLLDKVLIGIEKSDQLTQNLNAVLDNFPMDKCKSSFESILVTDQALLNPSNWKP